ncbi:MAG: Gfo/Idh/MocA family oxidoreductase, partial [Planctomycetes bacterium]|nr:Gfo/Idh/MocA family oxidoreductase [Planctomycetota bacterium]
LQDQGKRYGVKQLFKDYREMIDTVDLDAVVISTPDHHHAPAAARAMKKGRHVYCEKPLTHTVHEARVLAALAKQHGVVTQLGTQNHFHPVNVQAQAILERGDIGDVREVHVITDRPGTWWDQGLSRPTEAKKVPDELDWDLWLGPAPVRPYHPAYAHFRWRGWWDFGCGAVGDMAIHLMDLAVYALELDAPIKVTAQGSKVLPESGPTAMVATFEYAARGSRPPCRVVWYEGTAKPPAHIAAELPMNGSLFIGDRGRLAVDHCKKNTLLPEGRFGSAQLPALGRHASHHGNWIDACKSRGKADCDFADAGPFTEQVLLANVAYRTGRAIYWRPDEECALGLPEAGILLNKHYRRGWEL